MQPASCSSRCPTRRRRVGSGCGSAKACDGSSRCANKAAVLSRPPACHNWRAASHCPAAGRALAACSAASGGCSVDSWRSVSGAKPCRLPCRPRDSRLSVASPFMASTVACGRAWRGNASFRCRAGSPNNDTARMLSACASHWAACLSSAAIHCAGVRSTMRSWGWLARWRWAASMATGAARSVTMANSTAALARAQANAHSRTAMVRAKVVVGTAGFRARKTTPRVLHNQSDWPVFWLAFILGWPGLPVRCTVALVSFVRLTAAGAAPDWRKMAISRGTGFPFHLPAGLQEGTNHITCAILTDRIWRTI